MVTLLNPKLILKSCSFKHSLGRLADVFTILFIVFLSSVSAESACSETISQWSFEVSLYKWELVLKSGNIIYLSL
jgi:hypothetical protein